MEKKEEIFFQSQAGLEKKPLCSTTGIGTLCGPVEIKIERASRGSVVGMFGERLPLERLEKLSWIVYFGQSKIRTRCATTSSPLLPRSAIARGSPYHEASLLRVSQKRD